MPLYVFSCLNCGETVEFALGFNDIDHETSRISVDLSNKEGCICPKCASTKFKKEIAAHGKMADNWSKWAKK